MSAVPFSDRVRAEFDALQAALPEGVLPGQRRELALRRLRELGLPGLRDDDWRYTNLRGLQSAVLRPVTGAPGEAAGLPGLSGLPPAAADTLRLVFVDGVLARPQSGDPTAFAALAPLAQGSAGERGGEERFALLNDAFAVDAARYAVRGRASLELVWIASGAAAASYPRLELHVAAGAEMQLVERHLGPGRGDCLIAPVVNITLGAGARCVHTRLQDLSSEALLIETLRTRLDRDAAYDFQQLQLGGGTVRSTVGCELAGRAARASFGVASIADGRRSHDTVLRVRHAAPDTVSHQELRALASDQAGIAFQSAVTVAREAPGSDSRQSLRGLIGGPSAEVNLRPQLEIDVDKVTASHGATTGTLDEAMLFYLLSRGLDPETARLLLEWAFVGTVLSRAPTAALRREAEERTVARLGNRAAEELLK